MNRGRGAKAANGPLIGAGLSSNGVMRRLAAPSLEPEPHRSVEAQRVSLNGRARNMQA
jgi:hypothetical protein